jgi:tRNA(fMet)-specific endonuclease VapC
VFESTFADIYGRIRSYLESHGRPIGPNDLLIVATALAHSLTVVTHNRSEFASAPGLRFKDWEEPGSPDL